MRRGLFFSRHLERRCFFPVSIPAPSTPPCCHIRDVPVGGTASRARSRRHPCLGGQGGAARVWAVETAADVPVRGSRRLYVRSKDPLRLSGPFEWTLCRWRLTTTFNIALTSIVAQQTLSCCVLQRRSVGSVTRGHTSCSRVHRRSSL